MEDNPATTRTENGRARAWARTGRALAAIAAVVAAGVIGATLLAAPPTFAQEDGAEPPSNEACLTCHARRSLDLELPSGEVVDVTVDGPGFDASVHGRAGAACVDCHTTIAAYPHSEPGAATARDLTVDLNGSCGDCHGEALAWEVVHGASADPGSPVCSDCHGAHEVAPVDPPAMLAACSSCHLAEGSAYESSVHSMVLRSGTQSAATCAGCHAAGGIHSEQGSALPSCATCHSDVGAIYDASVHGMAMAAGESQAATCSDCHGAAHDMKGARDTDATTYALNLPQTCGMCHGDPELTARLGLDDVYDQYIDSIHGRDLETQGLVVAANCTSCHGSHGIQPPDDATSTVYPLHVPQTCGTCHTRILEQYQSSVHGTKIAAGDLAAAICTDCHSVHTITQSEAEDWQLDVIEECGTCHEASFNTFRDTFHGQASGLGFTRAARCSDCHGAHDILPIEDPASSVALDNRVDKCRQCHPDANRNFARYSPHADHGDRENYPALYYGALLMNGLIIGVFAFFGVHTLLWFNRTALDRLAVRRARRRRRSRSSPAPPVDGPPPTNAPESDDNGGSAE